MSEQADTVVEIEDLPVSDGELDIMDCLRDYHRILRNVYTNLANGAKKRAAAGQRAHEVQQLIERLETLADEASTVQ